MSSIAGLRLAVVLEPADDLVVRDEPAISKRLIIVDALHAGHQDCVSDKRAEDAVGRAAALHLDVVVRCIDGAAEAAVACDLHRAEARGRAVRILRAIDTVELESERRVWILETVARDIRIAHEKPANEHPAVEND